MQDFRSVETYGYLPPDKVVALCTGSQGEARAALSRIAEDQHPDVAIVGIPFDTAASFRPGQRFGPSAVRDISVLLRPSNQFHGINAFDRINARGGMTNCLQGSERWQFAHRAPPAPAVETVEIRRPFLAEPSAPDLVDALEWAEFPFSAVAFFVALAASTAST